MDDESLNPYFPLTVFDAEEALDAMAESPRRLQCLGVGLGGFLDLGVVAQQVARKVHDLTGDDRVIAVSVAFCSNFDVCRDRVIERVVAAFG